MTFSLGATSNANLSRVHPDLQRVVRQAITLTKQDFCVYDGARTAQEQNALFKKGVSQKDGFKNKSNHQITADGYGHAVDLVPWVNGRATWDDSWVRHYDVALAMSQASKALGIKIKWGGNWFETMDQYGDNLDAIKAAVARYKVLHAGPDFIDAPHFELAA